MRRFRFSLRNPLLACIYVTALAVWVALVADTVGLAQHATRPPVYPTPVVIIPTAVPTPAPQIVPPKRPSAPDRQVLDIAPETQVRHPKTGRYISAWLSNSFGSVNRASFEANADILDEVSPFWYSPSSSGGLRHGNDARDATLVSLARDKSVLVIPTVHNVVTGADPVPGILRSPSARARHIEAIVNEVLTYNSDGIDIDYEFLDSSLRDEYTAFIVDLAENLHSQGKLVTIAVHAKDCDRCGLGAYQDWETLGKVVDRLRIMTYDYHWRGGGPGPVAPLYWVNRVAAYAKEVVDPAKVVIGVPFYGYNWPVGGGTARGQTWDMINDIIKTYELDVNLKESNENGLVQENWIRYSSRSEGTREVWFATSSGLDAKLHMVQDMDLAGIAIWQLGGEDPRNWEIIRARLVQDPFESQRMLNQVLPDH
jgi:spore germination protein YaaH